MRFPGCLVLQCLWHLSLVLADIQAKNYFILPSIQPGPSGVYTHNPVYQLGSSVKFEWQTTFSSYNVVLCQQDTIFNDQALCGPTLFSSSSPGQNSFTWTVQTSGFSRGSHVYYLDIDNTGANQDILADFTSHYFNITKISSSKSSSSSSSSMSSTTTHAQHKSTLSMSPSRQTHSSSAGSNDVALGVSLGVGLSVLIIIAAVTGCILIKRKRRKQQQQRSDAYFPVHYEKQGDVGYHSGYGHEKAHVMYLEPGELPASQEPAHELPS